MMQTRPYLLLLLLPLLSTAEDLVYETGNLRVSLTSPEDATVNGEAFLVATLPGNDGQVLEACEVIGPANQTLTVEDGVVYDENGVEVIEYDANDDGGSANACGITINLVDEQMDIGA